VAVAWAIHRPDPAKGDERNVHVHLMATTREATRGPTGWTLGAKRRDLDQKQSLAAFKKDAAAILDDWAQRTGQPHEQRAAARDALRGYKQADAHLPEPLRRRGTEHLGPALAAMERAGEQTGKGARNQEQRRANAATIAARRAAADADAAAGRVADRLRAEMGPGPRKPAAQATPGPAPSPQGKAQAAHPGPRRPDDATATPEPGPRTAKAEQARTTPPPGPEQQAPQDRHARRDQRPDPPPQDQTERHRENGPHAGQQQSPRDDDAPRPGERRRPDLPPIRDLPAYLAWTIRMECRDNDADRARAQAGRIRALAWAVETLGPKDGARAYNAAYETAMQRLGVRGTQADRARAARDAVLAGAIKESGATASAPAPLTAWAEGVLDRAAEIHRRQPFDAFTPWGWYASTARAQGLPGKSRTERETEQGAARLAALLRMWQDQAARQDDLEQAPPPWATDDERRRAAEAAAWARVWRFDQRHQRDGPTL
jgi:hypothetical protein